MNKEKIKIVIILMLIVASIAIYWPVQNYVFINIDDPQYVFENPHVLSSLSLENIGWAFTTTDAGSWHPLTWLSLMLDHQLFMLNAGGYHWNNLILHIISTILLFLILNKMTGSLRRSCFVAALFALHPLHVESVAWIAERKDVLSTVFWMLTMYVYLFYLNRQTVLSYLSVLLVFVLGLMAKPMLVTLPFVLLLMDYWPLQRFHFELRMRDLKQKRKLEIISTGEGNSVSRIILEKIPLIILSVIFSVIAFIAQSTAVVSLKDISVLSRISNALVSYVEYIKKMFVPVNLAVFYPEPAAWPLWQVLMCLIVLTGITLIVVFYIKKYQYLAVGWFWYLGTLVPVIGIIQVGLQSMADRYTYIPLIGLFVIISWGLSDLTRQWKRGKIIFTSVAIAIIGVMMVLTSYQIRHWESNISLFSHALAVTSRNYVAHTGIAGALIEANKIDEGIEHYYKAIEIKNNYPVVYYQLGYTLATKGYYNKALDNYYIALQLDPNSFHTHYFLADLLSYLNRSDEAIFHYLKAAQLRPDYARIHYILGNLLSKKGENRKAINEYYEALRLKPDLVEGRSNLAMLLLSDGKTDEAISQLKEAIRLQPEYANAHYCLAKALKRKGLLVESNLHYKEAIRLNQVVKDRK